MKIGIFRPIFAACAMTFAVLALQPANASSEAHSYAPPEGVIANEIVARAIAMIYLSEVYGKAQIQSQLPLLVSRKGDVWTIKGSFNIKHSVGGVAEIDLAQQDGRVLRLTHSM